MAKFIIDLEDRPEDDDINGTIEYEVATAQESAALDDALGLKSISIRLQNKLIDDLKTIAKVNGIGYQPLIRILLTRFAESELRQIARHQAEVADAGRSAEAGEEVTPVPPYETALLKAA